MADEYTHVMTVVKHNNEVFLRYRTDNCVILLYFTVLRLIFNANPSYTAILSHKSLLPLSNEEARDGGSNKAGRPRPSLPWDTRYVSCFFT